MHAATLAPFRKQHVGTIFLETAVMLKAGADALTGRARGPSPIVSSRPEVHRRRWGAPLRGALECDQTPGSPVDGGKRRPGARRGPRRAPPHGEGPTPFATARLDRSPIGPALPTARAASAARRVDASPAAGHRRLRGPRRRGAPPRGRHPPPDPHLPSSVKGIAQTERHSVRESVPNRGPTDAILFHQYSVVGAGSRNFR